MAGGSECMEARQNRGRGQAFGGATACAEKVPHQGNGRGPLAQSMRGGAGSGEQKQDRGDGEEG